jgi:cobalt ECF transporter T component CbiQ
MGPETRLPAWFKESLPGQGAGRAGAGPGLAERAVERTLRNIRAFMKDALSLSGAGAGPGLLQGINPMARVPGAVILIAACSAAGGVISLLGMTALTTAMALLSGVSPWRLARKALLPAAFTATVAAPATLSVFSPGETLITLGVFDLSFTRGGVVTALLLTARVAAISSIASLMVITSGASGILKGLKGLHVPAFFVTALFMTFGYVFLLVKTAEDAALARRSRTAARARVRDSGRWFASGAELILKKSLNTAGEVNMAMASRGFDGRLKTLKGPGLKARDYAWLGLSIFVFFLAIGV